MIIVNFLGLWHYERPELFGIPTWAGCGLDWLLAPPVDFFCCVFPSFLASPPGLGASKFQFLTVPPQFPGHKPVSVSVLNFPELNFLEHMCSSDPVCCQVGSFVDIILWCSATAGGAMQPMRSALPMWRATWSAARSGASEQGMGVSIACLCRASDGSVDL